MTAFDLCVLAISEGRAEDGPVVVLVDGSGLTVLRTDGRMSVGVRGLTVSQACRLVDVLRASTEATDRLVAAWLSSELNTMDQTGVSQ